MKVKSALFSRDSLSIGDGRNMSFWEDTWLGDTSLALQHPRLYNIVQRKEAYVAAVLGAGPLNIQFHRALAGDK